jgi:hypothetical protein
MSYHVLSSCHCKFELKALILFRSWSHNNCSIKLSIYFSTKPRFTPEEASVFQQLYDGDGLTTNCLEAMHHAEGVTVSKNPSMHSYFIWLNKEMDKIQADLVQGQLRLSTTLSAVQKHVKSRDQELQGILDVLVGGQIDTKAALDQIVKIWTRWRSLIN